jgi:hypothetical protein
MNIKEIKGRYGRRSGNYVNRPFIKIKEACHEIIGSRNSVLIIH